MLKLKPKVKRHKHRLFTFFSLFPAVLLFFSGISNATEVEWDPAKYISIDEIKPGMEAYCLTCYSGTTIEKFDLDVISVVRNYGPGRDAILVQGTDERFIHTGPVWGCSGSPVYIDGRLAGALAFASTYSKDPLYGVTPIREMLTVGKVSKAQPLAAQSGYNLDFSEPIDLVRVDKALKTRQFSSRYGPAGISVLPCPLVTSGLPAQVTEQLNDLVEPFGLSVVAGIGGGAPADKDLDVQLAPGGCLVVPLVTGDITLDTVGTVTEVIGDKVYGFGHSFLGFGPVNLPMATGQVHTVMSNIARSSKLASMIKIVGALTRDESPGIVGQIGAKPHMFPLTITIDDYRDSDKRTYHCQVAHNRSLTSSLLLTTVSGAGLRLGDLPPDHMIEYKVAIGVDDTEQIAFENVSTDTGLTEMLVESVSPVTMLLNNPYKNTNITSVDFNIRIVPKSIVSHIWSVDLSDSKVKAGETINITVVVESVLAGKKKYQCSFEIPETLPAGKYELAVCGGYQYELFLRKNTPYRFLTQNFTGLVEALKHLLNIDRDNVYCLLALPPGGVAIEKSELPDLPPTKALVLQNEKRALRIQPYQHWLEKRFETGTITIDRKALRITVEK